MTTDTKTTPAAPEQQQAKSIQEQPSQEQQQASEEEEEAALSAAFNEARGVVEPSAEVTAETTATETDAKTDAAQDTGKADDGQQTAPATPAEQAAAAMTGLSDEQARELLQKVPGLEKFVNEEVRKLYGKIGEVQGNLRSQQGQAIRKISKGALKRLNEEFPEIAEMLEQDLAEFYAGGGAPAATEQPAVTDKPAAPEVDVDARIQTAVAGVRKETEAKLLTFQHPDWQDIAKSPEFSKWTQTLPEADRVKYLDSDDSRVAAEAFTKFKEWRGKQQSSSARNKERLERAVAPTGDGAAPATQIDEDAALDAGFNSVRGRRR